MSTDVAERIRRSLSETLAPDEIEIRDDSALHAGHAGARSGGGHYSLRIVAGIFAGHGTIARHRMIYEALGDMMKKEIHALAIKAMTADEATQATHP